MAGGLKGPNPAPAHVHQGLSQRWLQLCPRPLKVKSAATKQPLWYLTSNPLLQALTEASHCGEQQLPLRLIQRACLQLHAWKQVEHSVVALVGRLHHCTGQFACSSTTGSQGLAPLMGLPQRAAGRRLPSHCSSR